MAWMLEDMPVEEMAASSHPLLGFSTAVMTDYDGLQLEGQNFEFDSLFDLKQWDASGDNEVNELHDEPLPTYSLPDMNDPKILEMYSSLVILANDESDQHLEFQDCDSSKQSTLQALARKLGLRYQCGIGTDTVEIDKYPHNSCQINNQITSTPLVPPEDSQDPSIDEITLLAGIRSCWKCDILKEKCDMHQPCKVCQRFESSTWHIWHDIGCRMGSFGFNPQVISLCLKDSILFPGLEAHPQADIEACLKDSSRRLKAVLDDASISPTRAALETLCQTSLSSMSSNLDSDFNNDLHKIMMTLAWEFIDNPLVKRTICVESIENTFEGIRAATAYGIEDKGLSIIPLAFKCLRICVNILRLHNSKLLRIHPHDACDDSICHVQCIQELVQCLQLFWDEFLNTMTLRVNQQEDKSWWLHSFYSLWLQTFVHRTIWSLRKEFSLPFENTWNDYQLALRLFTASGGNSSYDPLTTSWSLDDLHNKPSAELSQTRFYYLAQKTFDTPKWKASSIHSSYEYLAGMMPLAPLEIRTQHDRLVDEERRQDKTAISSQQHNKSSSVRPRESSFRGARRHRIFTLEDDSDDEDLYCQAPLPRKNVDLPLSTLGRARNRSRAKRKANSPPIDIIGSLSESGSAMTRSSLSLGMSPTLASYPTDIGNSDSPLHINTPTSILSIPSLPRSPMMPDKSAYSSSIGSMGVNGTPLTYVSSHESLSAGFQSTSIASSNSRAIWLLLMCTCCPKKPKRFETQEDLRAHEAKKQYECSYCGNRFKSKNEAERHQNSLHVRQHSWSCSSLLLIGYDRAFSDSTKIPGQADVCGYCGDEFVRSGGLDQDRARHPTEHDWDERLLHLQEVHKFRECNSSKKFYRADHFRQHLKHSHASTSGKWTNMLENACMSEEEPPQPPNVRST